MPFATNHGFYGEMDFFLDMPADTDERGLGDFGVRIVGDDATYVRSSMRNVEDGRGVQITGDNALVERSTFANVQRSHVNVIGDNAVVRRCDMALGDDDGVNIEGADARVTWTLPRPTTVRAMLVQGDNNDTYVVEGSLDGRRWSPIWTG